MYRIYQIEYGDNLLTIANKTGSTIDEIKKINGISGDYDLNVGQLIIVPSETNNMFKTYIVKNGDTIYSVSKMFNIDVDTLLKINGLNKNDYIYPNQELIIPDDSMDIYITKENDTIDTILKNLDVDILTLLKENNKIFVAEDQMMVHKKRDK